jgi:regulator of protease activity HflC (stomatin/prohibitin superfamily)
MLLLKYVLLMGAIGMLVGAAAMVAYDFYLNFDQRRRVALVPDAPLPIARPVRWELARSLALWSLLPLLAGMSIAVVPAGMAAVRVSQISGTRPGTLYAGTHFVLPFVQQLAIYDVRDKVYATGEPAKKKEEGVQSKEPLNVQAKEGLPLGLAIMVRYRLDAARLDYIHTTLPDAIDSEIVQPVVGSTFRSIIPNYTVRDVFSDKREEIRQLAAEQITRKLGADGIQVKEVMLRDIQLPPEYAKGLEGLLLKEQENDQMAVQTEIQAKQVRISELQAEAEKVQQIKHAEAEAQTRVLQAKAESDAMKYTLPLKEKQIQQTRLESQARKEATVKNAQAMAEAKVIDSKAEVERRNLLTSAEANRIRLTAQADNERMRLEAAALKQNPLLINKIIAERLSDKLQIMMVPADGKYFFASDVLRGTLPKVDQMDEQNPRGGPQQQQDDGAADPPAVMQGRR